MYAIIYKSIKKNSQLFYSRQFGFRSNHSTNHALISITESINKNSTGNGKFGFDTFQDLERSHSIVLDKLSYYGVTSIALKWYDSYLSNRKQFVLANGVSSDLFY